MGSQSRTRPNDWTELTAGSRVAGGTERREHSLTRVCLRPSHQAHLLAAPQHNKTVRGRSSPALTPDKVLSGGRSARAPAEQGARPHWALHLHRENRPWQTFRVSTINTFKNPTQEHLTLKVHSEHKYSIYLPHVFPGSILSWLLLKMVSVKFQITCFCLGFQRVWFCVWEGTLLALLFSIHI